MDEIINIVRYDSKYSCYMNQTIEQQEMLCTLVKKSEEDFEDCALIINKIFKKELFAFTLTLKNQTIGFLAIDNIDWENRNCRLKGAVFEEYVKEIDLLQLSQSIQRIIQFCAEQLRIKKIWGVLSKDSFANATVDENFIVEGISTNKEIYYYGYSSKEIKRLHYKKQ